MARHDEFLELCAVSTSGSLSEPEKARLEAHLAVCAGCREALKEFQDTAKIAVPMFAAEASRRPSPQSESWSVGDAEKRFRERLARESNEQKSAAFRNGRVPYQTFGDGRRSATDDSWKLPWVSLAAAILLAVALGVVVYHIGMNRGFDSAKIAPANVSTQVLKLQEEASDAGYDREILLAQMAQRDKAIAGLQHQQKQKIQELNSIKATQTKLLEATSVGSAEKQQLTEAVVQLSKALETSEASVQKTQGELEATRGQRGRDEVQVKALQAKVDDLNHLLQEREATIDRQQEFLAKDRDVRELMGARDLYIAEVFDVAKTGAIKKPYGRMFYTKGKSLVFFAYDLDKQAEARDASTFQAWGRRGNDKAQSLSLGIFYEDNSSKKRWKLQFDDPLKLDQIDAVFVTVEPAGGSRLPSGKPLLFAYLKIDPNHP
jgi:hypothetical protein